MQKQVHSMIVRGQGEFPALVSYVPVQKRGEGKERKGVSMGISTRALKDNFFSLIIAKIKQHKI